MVYSALRSAPSLPSDEKICCGFMTQKPEENNQFSHPTNINRAAPRGGPLLKILAKIFMDLMAVHFFWGGGSFEHSNLRFS